jgi:hypothetical protein
MINWLHSGIHVEFSLCKIKTGIQQIILIGRCFRHALFRTVIYSQSILGEKDTYENNVATNFYNSHTCGKNYVKR